MNSRRVGACVVAILIASFMTTVSGQEPGAEADFGDIIGDIRTFGGRFHEGFVLVPGLQIQLFFPLHHWEGGTSGGPFTPEWQVNKTPGSGRCQVCVYLLDNTTFFQGTPGGPNPLVSQVCKAMGDAQRSTNVRLPGSANPNEHGDAFATMACENPAFVQFRTKRIG